MREKHVVIVGGGLAGLSAGCYARACGMRTTIVEHGLALGGVCTAWARGPYTIDGCIHWLTGGKFDAFYRELGILPRVRVRALERFVTYRDVRDGAEVVLARDLAATARALRALAPEDADEIQRIVDGAGHVSTLVPPVDRPPELSSLREQLASLWGMRHDLGTIAHFRRPLGAWAAEHLRSARLRRMFLRMFPEDTPAMFLLMVLGYLERGWLSRPEGGTARFRDAIVDAYRAAGGEAMLHATVDEVLVDGDRARGVRLADGSILEADVVISTSSMPETVLRLLGGRYGGDETRARMKTWKLFDPIVLASYGVGTALAEVPQLLLLDHVAPLSVGGVENDHLYVRVCNDDASLAPPGHAVVQLLLRTDYGYWAKTGSRYQLEKEAIAARALDHLDEHLPGVRAATRVTDVATPLTYWSTARSWRGAYEGWMPRGESMFGHVKKTRPGLRGFYMAGQWVEPGGGVPTALMSGRHVAQLVCADERIPFVTPSAR